MAERPVLRHQIRNGKIYSKSLPDYVKRDEGEGFVYLVRARGFHGILSPLLKREKIGLTNNPERRLRELNSEQAPCEIEGIRYIQVDNNAKVEAELHKRFARNRVHGEWFDFMIWERPIVHFAFDCYVDPMAPWKLGLKVAAIVIPSGIVLGLLLTFWVRPPQTQPTTPKPTAVKVHAPAPKPIKKVSKGY